MPITLHSEIPNKPKAIGFDCYKTLFSNSEDGWIELFKEIIFKQKIPLSPENFWKKWNNLDSSKWKVYGFNYEFHDKFMGKDWGISHSAHIYEPFGYSIFQAVDYGKVPILAEDWLPQYKYPLRASNPKDFKLQYERICKMGLDERRDILFPLREYLTEHFGNKQRWVEQMLRIYNS